MRRGGSWMMPGLMLAALLAAAPAPPARGADRTEVPQGAYQPVRLRFEKAYLASKQPADVEDLAAFRGGKLATPGTRSVREWIATLTLDGSHIAGTYAHYGQKDDHKPLILFEVDATVTGRQIAGTYKATAAGKNYDGKLTGELIDEDALRQSNAFAGKADWPCWSGPTQSLVATPTGVMLVNDLAKARLLWRSEDRLPAGLGNLTAFTRRFSEALTNGTVPGTRTGGGGASPVFEDGRVYVYYFQPAGDDYDPAAVKRLEDFAAQKGLGPVSKWAKEKWAKSADDVVICMDAATGRTLWKTTFEGKGFNRQDHKSGPTNCTPCVGGGRVFTLSSGGHLYALDAASGRPLWEKEVGPKTFGTRDFNNAPILVGDVVVTGDQKTTLYGFDAATGRELWKLPGLNHPYAVPVAWRHAGTDFVLTHTRPQGKPPKPSEMACVEAATGRVAWKTELGLYPAKGLCVAGDTVVTLIGCVESAADEDEKPAAAPKPAPAGAKPAPAAPAPAKAAAGMQCVAYRLSPDKAERAWATPCGYATVHFVPVATPDGFVYLSGRQETHVLDLATGKDLAKAEVAGAANEGYGFVVEDRLLIRPDGSHGHESPILMLHRTPDDFRAMGPLWHPPHPPTCSYHMKPMTSAVVEGRLFMRGYDGVYCYDLRVGQ